MWSTIFSKPMNKSFSNFNPYSTKAVGNTPKFVGREDVLKAVRDMLAHPTENAIVLYGQRRIGKTSILETLNVKLAEEGHLPIFFDLEDQAKFPLEQVLQKLSNKICSELPIESKPLQEVLTRWQSFTTKKLVILFDEFDIFAANEIEAKQAGDTFFPYWRETLARIDPKQCKFVFVIGRRVEELNQQALSSFKAARSMRVSLLTEEATRKLIKLSDSDTNKTLKWEDASVDKVWTQTCGHPYLTQILCRQIWESLCLSLSSPSNIPLVKPIMVDEAVATFLKMGLGDTGIQWLWDGLPPTEKLATAILASREDKPVPETDLARLLKENGIAIINPEIQRAAQVLQDWDVIELTKGIFRFRVELFRRWIAVNKQPLSKVQQELDSSDERARNYYESGKTLYTTGQTETAIVQFKYAVQLKPDHIGANQYLTTVLLQQKQFHEAWQYALALYLLRPKLADSLLIEALGGLIASTTDENEQLGYCEETLRIVPDCEEANKSQQAIWQRRGDEAFQKGELEQALELYRKANLKDKIEQVQQQIYQTQGLAVKVNEILKEVHNISPEVVATILIEREQFLVRGSFRAKSYKKDSELNDNLITDLAKRLLEPAETIVQLLLNHETLEQIYVKTQGKYVILNAIGSRALLLVITTTKAKLGLISFGLDHQIIPKLAELLDLKT
jgi:predicted regulator of Ras-like GTPase activity (Roadblock/LC7/MglB family)